MGVFDDTVEVARRTMVLFFLVDTSGSMSGDKIGTVNHTMEEVVPELQDISATNADAQLKVATMSFSTGAKWVTGAPVPAEDFNWSYLDASGLTDLGEACYQLNEKLSRSAFMSDVAGSFAPAIFLMSDGEPTDNYQKGLDKLKKNNWFRKAIKVAIAIGEDANTSVLAEFTGNSEAVIVVNNAAELRRWIQFVSVRASEIGSKSASVGGVTGGTPADGSAPAVPSKQDDFIDEVKKQKIDLQKNPPADKGWGDDDW